MKTIAFYSGIVVLALSTIIGCSPSPKKALSAPNQTAQAPVKQANATPKAPAKKAPEKKPVKPKKVLKVVKTWDFTALEKDAWEWEFPRPDPMKTDSGVFYVADRPDAGPKLFSDAYPVSSFTAVRVEYRVLRKAEDQEKPAPVKLETNPVLYWARTEHIEKKDDTWPFVIGRNKGFDLQNPKYDFIWVADADKHPEWKGDLAGLYIALPLPKDAEKADPPYNVVIKKIELLK